MMIYEGNLADGGVCRVVIPEESGAEAGVSRHIGGGSDEQRERLVWQQVTQTGGTVRI